MSKKRQNEIIKILTLERMVRVKELVTRFNVSGESIRRDMEQLEKDGLIKRIHGGAILDNMHSLEVTYSKRKVKNYKEKISIGIKAAELINDGDSVAIDLGTTTEEVARSLATKINLTIITNSINAALILMKNPTNKVFLVGGLLRSAEASTSGYLGIEFLSNFRVDKALLGVGGISIDGGITDYHTEESFIRRKMIDIAGKTIVVASYSKFGITTLNKTGDVDKIDFLVTDWKTSNQILTQFKDRGITVLVGTQIR